MHVMIDAREAGPQPSGLARYTFNLLRGLARYASDVRFTVLSNHPELLPELAGRDHFTVLNPRVHIIDPSEHLILGTLAARFKPDLFHSPSMVAPYVLPRGTRRLITLHDTIPLSYPQGFQLHQRLGWAAYYAATIRPLARRADRVVTVSDWSRDDIHRHLGVARERITVVHNWLEDRFVPATPAAIEEVRGRYGLPRRFAFALGSHYGYKNMDGLLRGFARMAHAHPDLHLVIKGGSPAHLRPLIGELGLTERVRLMGYVPDGDLPAVYGAAQFFAFPSHYEGFGLPALEALRCGVPVAASHASSLPEVVGDAAVCFDPADPEAIAHALDSLAGDPALRERLREAGMRRSATFTPEAGIRSTLAVYEEALRLPARAAQRGLPLWERTADPR